MNERAERYHDIMPDASWETVFDHTIDFICFLDRQFEIVKTNKSFARVLGREPHDLVGKKCYEIMHGTKVPTPDCPHLRAVTDGKAYVKEFYENHLGMQLFVSVSPVFDDAGICIGSVHIARDMTKMKKTGKRLQIMSDGQGEQSKNCLPPRQRELLDLVCEGLSAKEIALRMAISPRTVEFHKDRLMKVLGIRTLAGLIKYAMVK